MNCEAAPAELEGVLGCAAAMPRSSTMRYGDAKLVAKGAAELFVLTSAETNPLIGDWEGMEGTSNTARRRRVE